MMDRDTGLSRGLGIVEFDSASAASAAVKTLNGTQVCDQYVHKVVYATCPHLQSCLHSSKSM
jgi:RNA recognition motif-containing protein